jgi:C1A family cysteine protease
MPMHAQPFGAGPMTTRSLAIDGAGTGSFPAAMDLRGSPGDGPVKDQAMVGVCWSFALSSIMENALSRQGTKDVVAPLHLIVSDAWTSLHERGTTDPMVSGASWAYDPAKACKLDPRPDGTCEDAYHVKQGSWQADSSLHAEVDQANAHGAYKVIKVENIDPMSFDALAEVIAAGEEAYLSVDIDDQAWSRPKQGVIDDYADGNRGRHAVTVVGYRTSGPRGREILVKNSWGTDWGDGGYAWLTETMLTKHANDMFTVQVQRTGSGGGFNLPQPNPATPSSPFGFPLPPGLPALPNIPGLPAIPGFPQQQSGPNQAPQPAACAQGQVQDLVSRACVNPCSNGFPPAAGLCAP